MVNLLVAACLALAVFGCCSDALSAPRRLTTTPRVRSSAALKLAPVEAVELAANAASSLVLSAADNAVPSALAAYGHYFGLVLVTACLTAERLLIKPSMPVEQEKLLGNVDLVYGLAATLVLVSGYYRVTEFGKGWDFYQHEPIFWVKMLLFTVMGASSLLPTIKIVQRAIAINNAENGKGEFPAPMSEKLAKRLTTVVNGELLAIASIPLAAALMSRGVLYAEWLPWQAGAGAVGLGVFGLGFKYTREALTWQE